MRLLTEPDLEGTIELSPGRRLAFCEFGPVRGRPVVWMHGTPGARRQIPQAARLAAEELDIRIIGIDRPGVGDSTTFLYASLLDVVPDLTRLIDRLGIDRFAMLGLSGGGPYVLACAYALPERVVVGGVLGGVAPTQGEDAIGGGVVGHLAPLAPLTAAVHRPLATALGLGIRAMRPVASPAFELYARLSPEGDRAVFSRPEIKAMFLDDLLSGSRRGMAAPILDFLLFAGAWGFSVRDITVPVRWWHGDADNVAGARLAHGVAHPPTRNCASDGAKAISARSLGRGDHRDTPCRLGQARLGCRRRSRPWATRNRRSLLPGCEAHLRPLAAGSSLRRIGECSLTSL